MFFFLGRRGCKRETLTINGLIGLLNSLSANPTKWSDTLKQIVGYCFTPLFVPNINFSPVSGKNSGNF